MRTIPHDVANWIRVRLGEDDRGASIVEYALLVALIAVVCIVAVTALGNEAKSGFNSTADAISGVYHPNN